MLLLHTPNLRKISDIKDDDMTWLEKIEFFLNSDHCPNFVKADVEKAKTQITNLLIMKMKMTNLILQYLTILINQNGWS